MRKIFLIQLILFSVLVFGQRPKKFFTKFGGSGIDVGYSVKETLDRRYIVAGSTSSYGAGNTDVYLVKVDSMGFPIWEKTFGGFNNDVGRSVIQLSDSGYVVAGFTNSYGAGGYDAYILKTDKNGNLIWQKTFGGLDWDFAYDLVQATDGDIVVCGNTSSSGAGKKDGLLLKYDLGGTLVWQKTIGGIENEELRSVIKTNDNFLATVGYTESNGDVNGDVYFYKFDLEGNTIFYNIFGGPGKDFANDITQKYNNDYIIAGAKTYSSNPNLEGLMYSISSSGAFIYENHHQNFSGAEAEFVSVCSDIGNLTLTAFAWNRQKAPFKMQESIFIALPLGIYYFINEAGGSEDEYVYSLESTFDSCFISVGVTNSFGSLNGDVFLIKRDTTFNNNMPNLVGLKENQPVKPSLRYLSNSEFVLNSDNTTIVEYEIITIDGNVIFKKQINENEIKINLNPYPKNLLILRIKLSNGGIFNYKIPNN